MNIKNLKPEDLDENLIEKLDKIRHLNIQFSKGEITQLEFEKFSKKIIKDIENYKND